MAVLVFAHIVTFNHKKTIAKCIDALCSQEGFRPWDNILIRVTDNASTDGTVEEITSTQNQSIRLVRNSDNVGFSRAHNEGIRYASEHGAKYCLLLNPDVALAPDALKRLVLTLEKDTLAATACPTLLRGDDDLQPVFPPRYDSTGMYFTPALRHFDRYSEQAVEQKPTGDQYVFGASGAALLLRLSAIKDWSEVLDEDFFAYREDADFAWRLQWAGWNCRWSAKAEGVHKRHVLPENRRSLASSLNRMSVRNRFFLQMKNFTPISHWHCVVPTLLRNSLVIGAACSIELKSFPAIIDAIIDAPKMFEKRRSIMRSRKRRPFELAKWFSTTPYALPALNLDDDITKISSIQIIVINYNSGKRAAKLIKGLLAQRIRLARLYDVQISIVDNDSSDSSLEHIQSELSGNIPEGVQLFSLKENLGFAGGINFAAKNSDAEALLVLNPDIEIDAVAIQQLVSTLEEYPQLAAVAPKLLGLDAKPQQGFNARRLPTLGSTLAELFFLHKLFPKNSWSSSYLYQENMGLRQFLDGETSSLSEPMPNTDIPYLVEQPAASCILIRREQFTELSGFSTEFWPAWFEDVDFFKRLQNLGGLSAITALATAVHEGGYSKDALGERRFVAAWYSNFHCYWMKHGSEKEKLIFKVAIHCALALRAFVLGARLLVNGKFKESLSTLTTHLRLAFSKPCSWVKRPKSTTLREDGGEKQKQEKNLAAG